MKKKFLKNLICYMQIVCIVALSFGCLCIGGLAEEDVPMAVLLSEEQWEMEAEAMLQLASDELQAKLEESRQKMPKYARSIDECKNKDDLYVLPDGYVYGYFVRPGDQLIKNELVYAADEKGELYNMGLGYKDNTRYSTSSQEEKETEGWDVSGYIPIVPGNVIRVRNLDFFPAEGESRAMFVFFDYEHRYVTCSDIFAEIGQMSDAWAATADGSGQLVEFIIPKVYPAEIAYVRIVAKDIRPESIITVNHMIPETEGTGGWFRIENLFTDEYISTKYENLPDYWIEHLDVKREEIMDTFDAVGENSASFLWYTDAHWNMNAKKSPQLLKYLSSVTPISKTFYGGDIVYDEPTPETLKDESIMAYLDEWREAVKDIPNHHSAVGNHDDGNTTDNIFSAEYVYNYLQAPEASEDVVRGENLYYYIDSEKEQTRYVFLDTAFLNVLYDEAQQAWFRETLISTPANWHIIIVAHTWVTMDYKQDPPVVTDFSYGGKVVLEMVDEYNSRMNEYAQCEARVEFCIGGQSHIDKELRSETGIPVITTETDSRLVRSGLSDDKGTINENAVSAVIVDYDARIIHILRVGRGQNMQISF